MWRTRVSLAKAGLLLSAQAAAQESASSGIVAQVTDSTRAALPGATVTVTNTGTNAERTAITDAEGRFSIPNLRPGTYRVRVELDGFQTAEIADVVLRLGQVASPVVVLGVAHLEESVTVGGAAPLLQTKSASVGQVIAEKQLESLPTRDRNLLQFATLAAGVSSSDRQSGSRAWYVTVEGGRDSSTNYSIDGVYVRSLRFNNLSLLPPADSVQEVSLLRNSFSTEYGQGQAVISMATKSGTNQFSGSVSEYFRNEQLNARNYFAPTDQEKPPFRRSVFGATLGGPIVRNRIFGFGSYEGARNKESEIFQETVPDRAMLAGDFSSLSMPVIDPLTGRPFPGNIVPPERFSRFARAVTPTIPAPNNPGVNNYLRVGNTTRNVDTLTARLDEVLGPSHSFFQRFMWFDNDEVNENAFDISMPPEGSRNLAVGHTWVISPSLVNEVRVGYNHYERWSLSVPYDPEQQGRNVLGAIGIQNIEGAVNPLYYGPPGGSITGYSGFPGWGRGQGATETIVSLSNATSKTWKNHNLRFGVQAQYRKYYQGTPVSPRGAFTFDGIFTGEPVADYLLGYCSLCRGQFGTSDSDYRSPTVAPFVDDVWQVTNALTVQLGLRWEYLAPWAEVNDIEGSFDPETGMIAYHNVPDNIPPTLAPLTVDQDGYFPKGITQADLNNWAPRVGATYNLNDRTVIRSGFGIYYDNLNLNELQFTRLVPPFAGRFDITPDVDSPVQVDTLFPDLSAIERFPAPFSMNPDNRSAYTVQWNVNVQRAFGGDYVFEVAYTGSRGRNLHKRFNLNQPLEGTTPITERLPYPTFDPAILTSSNDGRSDFEGLSFRVEKRYSAGFYFLGTYQISSNRDTNSGEAEANDTAFRWDKDADYGWSRYHQRHRGTISFGYDLPFGDGKRWLSSDGLMGQLLGGWQIAGLIRMQRGIPY
ncbi:MAG: carboxypeptidase regulatory-like domain-containing protein, partial [Vicinamibacteraceae bacterium]